MESHAATDLDILVRMGYPDYYALYALRTTKGDLNAAIAMLKENKTFLGPQSEVSETDASSWYGEQDDDWVNYIPTNAISTIAENRGLFKSPIYIRVSSFVRREEEIYFVLNVSLKDQRTWSVQKTFTELLAFKNSLPFTILTSMTNHFPMPRIFNKVNSKEFQEERRRLLEEWIRELILSETCMKNPVVLQETYKLIEIDSHGGIVAKPTTATLHRSFFENPAFSVDFKNFPAIHASFPVPISVLLGSIPCRVPHEAIRNALMSPEAQSSASVNDVNEKQLKKDYSRDRLVIQGRRILGSSTSTEDLREILTAAINFQLQKANIRVNFISKDVSDLTTTILRTMGRTESAFLSHLLLSQLVDTTAETSDEGMPYLIVPESLLASPIEFNFYVTERQLPMTEIAQLGIFRLNMTNANPNPSSAVESDESNPNPTPHTAQPLTKMAVVDAVTRAHPRQFDWCIRCEAQAMTVFRIVDPSNMSPLAQLRVTYRKVLFAMPTVSPGASADHEGDGSGASGAKPGLVWSLSCKDGSTVVGIERETKTTSRDWRGDQTL